MDYRIQALRSLGSEKEGFEMVMLRDSLTACGNWATLLEGYDVANYGISGDTTTGILYRLSDVYMAHPKKVFLMVGINDITLSLAPLPYKENIKKIVNDLMEHNIEVVIQSILNTSQKRFLMDEIRNVRVDELNYFLKIYCNDKEIKYLDINQYLSRNGKLIGKYSSDGVHLNNTGYKKWRDIILAELL
jgi:lysophospholipase L1-like esterase